MRQARSLLCLLFLLSSSMVSTQIRAQEGDLPVPRDYDKTLSDLGFVEQFLPVQADTALPSPADFQRGWLLYQRDRNYEVLPNSKPAPCEIIDTLKIVATPGEIESQPFSAYALRDMDGLSAVPGVVGVSGKDSWLSSALKVEDVLFHPVQYQPKNPHAWPTGSYLRYPVFIRPASGYPAPAGTSRLYWATVSVPQGTPAGIYSAAVRLTDETGASLDLPVEVRVLPFKLTDKGIPRFGAFLSGRELAEGELGFMKRYGFDALFPLSAWGPNQMNPIRIINDNGRVRMDFKGYDAFVRKAQEAGMRGPLVMFFGNSYRGHYEMSLAKEFGLKLMNRELEGREVNVADFTDPRWDKLWIEGLGLIVEHAKQAGWPEMVLMIHDEPTKHLMAYHPHKYHLVKKHFPDLPVYGVFFQPQKDPGPLIKSCDIMVANRDLQKIKMLARSHGKRFWSYINICADQSFGKCRMLYGQIPSYYESELMWFWSWNFYVGDPWNDFDGRGESVAYPSQSDADWNAVYPSVDDNEPVRTLAVEAAREGIDDVRYIKTLENLVAPSDPERWKALRREIRRRQAGFFNGIFQDNRIYSDEDFFTTTRNDDVEKLRDFVIAEILKTLNK
jgi:Glycoside hydrolase 123, catalytic domain